MYSDWTQSNFFWTHRFALAGVFFALIAIDLAVKLWRTRKPIATRLVWVNGAIWLGELSIRRSSFPLRAALFGWLEQQVPFHAAETWTTVVLGYLAVDFIYYWKHRFYHQTEIGWALHTTHHSSREITLLAAIRLSWFEAAFDYLFFVPLLFLGLSPLLLFVLIEANGAYQFWLHTESIGRLRWLDPWLNTPKNHLRHHHINAGIAASNFGSTLMLWDRLFGTYNSEALRGPYGVDGISESANPFYLQFAGLAHYLAKKAPSSKAQSPNTPTLPH